MTDTRLHAHGKKNGKTACGLRTHARVIVSDLDEITCARCKPKPKLLRDKVFRERARHIRDNQWKFTERCAEHETFWFCVWNKIGREEAEDEWRDVLMSGMEIQDWINRHPNWFVVGEWDEGRYARPVKLTDAGRKALSEREKYDMEPVFGGMVEPGWKAVPLASRHPHQGA